MTGKKLQRYSMFLYGLDIWSEPDERGAWCDSKDVETLESENAALAAQVAELQAKVAELSCQLMTQDAQKNGEYDTPFAWLAEWNEYYSIESNPRVQEFSFGKPHGLPVDARITPLYKSPPQLSDEVLLAGIKAAMEINHRFPPVGLAHVEAFRDALEKSK